MNNDLKNCNYQIIFPENLKKYKNLKTLALEFEKNFKEKIIPEIDKLALYKNLELQPNEILSEIAWSLKVENWRETLNRNQKIALIKGAIHQWEIRGTKEAVTISLGKIEYPVKVKEWFEYGGKPFTFKITANFFIPDETLTRSIKEIIEKYKNCRSILENIEVNPVSDLSEIKISGFNISEIEKFY